MVTVESWGTGHPDYFRKTWEALRTKAIKEYDLKPTEKWKAFAWLFTDLSSPIPYRLDPLAPGASAHAIDMETGLPTPYTVPAGYELRTGPETIAVSEPCKINLYFDNVLVHELYNQYMEFYLIQELSTPFIGGFDPTYSSSHTVDWVLTNLGSSNLKGFCVGIYVLEAKRTKLIKTKKVRCKYCGCISTVSLDTAKFYCPKCGKLNLYMAFPFGGVK